eukprot:UN23542
MSTQEEVGFLHSGTAERRRHQNKSLKNGSDVFQMCVIVALMLLAFGTWQIYETTTEEKKNNIKMFKKEIQLLNNLISDQKILSNNIRQQGQRFEKKYANATHSENLGLLNEMLTKNKLITSQLQSSNDALAQLSALDRNMMNVLNDLRDSDSQILQEILTNQNHILGEIAQLQLISNANAQSNNVGDKISLIMEQQNKVSMSIERFFKTLGNAPVIEPLAIPEAHISNQIQQPAVSRATEQPIRTTSVSNVKPPPIPQPVALPEKLINQKSSVDKVKIHSQSGSIMVLVQGELPIYDQPDFNAITTGDVVYFMETMEYKTSKEIIINPTNTLIFYELKDGRGWVADYHAEANSDVILDFYYGGHAVLDLT